jgi:hypothetical protein
MPAEEYLQKDARTYTLDQQQYASVRRTNVLGCKKSVFVEVLMDDNTYRAYAGNYADTHTVNLATKATGAGIIVDALPMDVKDVGYQYLTAMNISAEQQIAMLAAWRSLPKDTQETYTAQWAALDKSDTVAVTAWINSLVSLLQSSTSA